MKLEEMTQELVNQAKACTTKEEILAFIKENNIELSAEQLEQISGGHDRPLNQVDAGGRECNKSRDGFHEWFFTGRTRPGTIWGSLWPDYEHKCKWCGKEEWWWT